MTDELWSAGSKVKWRLKTVQPGAATQREILKGCFGPSASLADFGLDTHLRSYNADEHTR